MMRDAYFTNTYLCTFMVPASSSNLLYSMKFKTVTDWQMIRAEMRVATDDAAGLYFDNGNLRYQPWLTFAGNKECVAPAPDETPTPPPDTELVENSLGVHPPEIGGTEGGCVALDWFNTDNWIGYLPTSEVQFVFDPFPFDGIFDANSDGVADTLYDALSYDGHVAAMPLLREAVIAMLNDRYDSNHPESWWAVEIDTAEALAQGENAMLVLAQQYALSNASCQ
jgi:hypothetical protein